VKARLPEAACSPELRRWAALKKKDWRLYALAGGEDYGLVFSCRPSKEALVRRFLSGALRVGEAVKGRGVEVEDYGGEIPVFEHF
jgi:thiamine monophosphate kinase